MQILYHIMSTTTTRRAGKLHLLVIRGLRPGDFDAARAAHSVPTAPLPAATLAPPVQYSKPPTRFTGVASWPRTTDLKCWTCDQLSSSYPCFIPMHYTEADGQPTCDAYGNFDKWPCVIRFINREYPAADCWDMHKAIVKIESLFTGLPPRKKIPEAPPKWLMEQYCGTGGLTLQQWRDLNQQQDADYSRVPGCLVD